MQESRRHRSVTRRAFLGTVLGAGTLAVPLARGASAATNTLYQLQADWGAVDPSCVPNRRDHDCSGCYACVNHAHNKVFATAAAADEGRAHARCRCLVAPLRTVDPATYDLLFAAGPSVDRRTPGIDAILARASVPAAHATLPFTGGSIGPLAVGGAGAVVVGTVLWRAGRMASPAVSKTPDDAVSPIAS
jgi:hypothetical protein